jgi:uncharacterized protein (TIRG00374 family)
VALVLWLVGWDDRVVEANGARHKGRIVEQTREAVLLERDGARIVVRLEEGASVRHGLGGALRNLAGSPGLALSAVLIQLAALLLLQVRWGIFLRGADLATPWREVFRLGFLGLFFNQVLPAGAVGGDLVKAYYAARRHPERKAQAVVSVLTDRGIGLFVICAVAAMGVLAAPASEDVALARKAALWLLAACVVALALLFSTPARRVLRIPQAAARLPFARVWASVGAAFALYGSRPAVVARAVATGLFVHGLVLATFYVAGLAVGAPMSAFAVFVAIPVAQMASAIPGLPAGWGIGDLAFYALLPSVGIPAGQAVALSFTVRAIGMALSLPGGLLLARAAVDRAAIARELERA